jgi:hypothetical protein
MGWASEKLSTAQSVNRSDLQDGDLFCPIRSGPRVLSIRIERAVSAIENYRIFQDLKNFILSA